MAEFVPPSPEPHKIQGQTEHPALLESAVGQPIILEPGTVQILGSLPERGSGVVSLSVPGIVPSNAQTPEMMEKIQESADSKPHIWGLGGRTTSVVIGAGVITFLTGVATYQLVHEGRFRSKKAHDMFTKQRDRLQKMRAAHDNDLLFPALKKLVKRRNKQNRS